MSCRSRFVSITFLVFACSSSLLSQTNPSSDPSAVAMAIRSHAAMTQGTAISDVSLTANITWIAGPEPEAGAGDLLAKGSSESRIDFSLNGGGKRTEIRNSFHGPMGKWINPDGKSGKYALHNCWTDAVWFFPALSSLASLADPRFVFSYIGEERWNGLSSKHVRIYQVQQGFNEAQHLSTMDFYLDPTSLLPLGVAYKTHSDSNMNVDISSEVRFDDYRLTNGVLLPFHIQRLQGGALLMDIAVTGAHFNTGVPNETFDTN